MSLEIDDNKFPNLRNSNARETSEATWKYNCRGWALGDLRNSWTGSELIRVDGYPYPLSPVISASDAMEDWIEMFRWHGFVPCGLDSSLEYGFMKIALYADEGIARHAAKQLPSGRWSSKLGVDVDIEHDLSDLEGPFYGEVKLIVRKSVT